MNSILARIQASQQANPFLQKAADGGPITDDGKKTAAIATDMIQGAENMPDVTKDPNTSDIADIGKAGEKVVNDEITPAAPIHDNEDNPDVQEILATAETVVKTANAMMPVLEAFSQMSEYELNNLFQKQASANDLSDSQMFDMIEKMAHAGSPLAQSFINYCAGFQDVMDKIANDAAALEAQGVPPEEAEAMALQAAAGGMPEEAPADVETEAGAELEAALAEITAEAAKEIMEVVPEASPEEAQAMAEELVYNKLTEEMGELEGGAGMEQTASGEEVPAETASEAEEVIGELVMATAEDIKATNPEVSDEEALEAATEVVADAVATAQEQEALGATDENGEYLVPDEVASEAIADMAKTAAANPLRDALTPVVATLFGVDQNAFINRLAR